MEPKYIIRRHAVFYFAIVFILAGVPLTSVRPVHAQETPITYEHFNTELTLREDDVLPVRIVQQLRFDGTFSDAFYAIPLNNLSSIANVRVYSAATESANYELKTIDLVPIAPNSVENDGTEADLAPQVAQVAVVPAAVHTMAVASVADSAKSPLVHLKIHRRHDVKHSLRHRLYSPIDP